MHRRNLVLRRFGAVDFGLGYFEDGAWIDHTTLADGGAGLDIGDGAFAEIHDLLGCCRIADPARNDPALVRSRPIPVEPGPASAAFVDRRDHVQSIARRSTAG